MSASSIPDEIALSSNVGKNVACIARINKMVPQRHMLQRAHFGYLSQQYSFCTYCKLLKLIFCCADNRFGS